MNINTNFSDRQKTAVFTLVWLLFYLPSVNLTPVGIFHDDSVYVLASRSLLGGGYSLPGNRQPNYTIPYPPGFPALLAPVAFFSPKNLNYYKLPSFLLSIGVICLFHLLRRDFAASMLLLLHPLMIFFSQTVMSEIPFVFFILLTFYLLEKDFKHRLIPFVFSVLSFMVFLTRPIGIVIFPSIVLFYALKKKYREAFLFSILSVILVSAYFFGAHSVPSGGNLFSYLRDPRFIFLNILFQGKYLLGSFFLPDARLPLLGQIYSKLGYLCLAAYIPVLSGWFTTVRKRGLLITEIFFVFYLAVLFLWKSPDARFLFPLIPFILAYYLEFFRTIPLKTKIKFVPVAFSAGLFVFSGISGVFSTSKSVSPLPLKSYEAAKSIIPENETTMGDATFYLYTGRKYHFGPPPSYIYPDSFFLYFTSKNIGYFFIQGAQEKSRIWGGFGNPNIQNSIIIKAITTSKRYNLIYDNPAESAMLYRINPEKSDNFRKAYALTEEVFNKTGGSLSKPEAAKLVKKLKKAITLDPELMEARNLLAGLYFRTGENADAITEITNAIRINPDYPYFYSTLGMFYEKQRNFEKAKQQYVISIEKAVNFGDEGLVENIKMRLTEMGK